MSTTQQVITNQIFLLGLDELYREAMKRHESSELLSCAQIVADTLNIGLIDVPIEGYYTESKQLTQYFLLIRSLQAQSSSRATELKACKEFKRLVDVTSSSLYGIPAQSGSLLPSGVDSLTKALSINFPNWTIDSLLESAYETAINTSECSLVGLAALAKDGVVLAAIRESVVLYAQALAGGCPPKPEYIWDVDALIEDRSRKFVSTFNELFDDNLPEPSKENAEIFCSACRRSSILGRCVRIGFDDGQSPIKHYHWAIDLTDERQYKLVDFWDEQIWTTEQYRQQNETRQ